MPSVGSPYSAAVAAVIGPIEAMVTRPRHARRSSSVNSSAKLRAVDELVNVTASIAPAARAPRRRLGASRSEEHTSELQSRLHLVCRLLLEKKKKRKSTTSCN